MRALIKTHQGPRITNKPTPKIKQGEVLVEVCRVGICRTDLQVLYGTRPAKNLITSGHEAAGIIIGAGSDLKDTLGHRVAIFPVLSCQLCLSCLDGLPDWMCEHPMFLGLDRDGAFAEYLSIPHKNTHVIPDQMPWSVAAYWEPVCAAWACVEPIRRFSQAGYGPLRIAVFGDGRIAELTHMILSTFHSNVQKNPDDEQHFDVCIETNTQEKTIERCVKSLRRKGLMILKSRPFGQVSVPYQDIVRREIVAVGAHYGNPEEAMLWMIAHQKKIEQNLLGSVYGLDQMDLAFEEERQEKRKIFFDPRLKTKTD